MQSHGLGCACSGFEVTDKDDDLFEVIDVEKVRCFNEDAANSCKRVFRAYSERAKFANPPYLAPSKGDSEILLVIPFTEEVKVRAIVIISGQVGKPQEANLWSNKENFDFSLVEEEPVNSLKLNDWTPCNGISVLTQ